ncbi:uncharacterized protein BDV17DRAFT_293957 [Aspergillus undulatus]|uniref:uncharacterized protein n=1 Tax=Aspergillus undulatus TaxID=1810928 RepID=UPI003CCE4167
MAANSSTAQAPPSEPAPSSPGPLQPLQQLVGYLEQHKLVSIILLAFFYPLLGRWNAASVPSTAPATAFQHLGSVDLIFATVLSTVAVYQNKYFSWQARFAYHQWKSLSSTFEQALGGSALTVGLLISTLSPLPLFSISTVLLVAWHYVQVHYHSNVRHVAAEVEQVSYKAKVALENSRSYTASISAYEASVLTLFATLYNDTGRYNLQTITSIGPLLTANIEAIGPAAKDLTGLATSSSAGLPKALQIYDEVRWIADKAILAAKHGETAEAEGLLASVSTRLTGILQVEAQLRDAKTKAHDISVHIHLDDLLDLHKKVIDQLQVAAAAAAAAAATPPTPEPRQAEPGELPNTVTLRNPKSLVGSLSGAGDNIDDVSFTLPTPFPITIYDHASSTLAINDNGMICLDVPPTSSIASVRTGQELPYRNGMAAYSVFPLWKDLKITKGKPHGIYYDVEGEEGNRKLSIEFYVTRYNMEDQYFHFLVIFEEARKNFVTFRYFDVQDQGAEGTVGVQGPQYHNQFSHNERKISPGLQLVFNTAPAVNDVQSSTFPLP